MRTRNQAIAILASAFFCCPDGPGLFKNESPDATVPAARAVQEKVAETGESSPYMSATRKKAL